LQIRNADGSPISGFGDKWIEITDADLAFLRTLNLNSPSTGAGAGKVAFRPLTLSFNVGSLAPYLFQAQAKGTAFQLEIATYKQMGNLNHGVLVDDYQFGLAALSSIDQHQSDERIEYSYSFEYGSERITHSLVDQTTGKITGTSTSGWDRITNTAITNNGVASSGKAVGSIHAPDQNPEPDTLIGGGGGKDFYVRFTSYDGSILKGDDGKAQWFEVYGLSFGSEQTLNIGSQSTGAGAGKIDFNPLSFTLGSSAGTTQLDALLAKGTAFKTIELVGYQTGLNGSAQAVSLSTFKFAAVKSDAIDVVTGQHALSFEYGGLVSKAATLNSDGLLSTGIPMGWNKVTNVSDDSLSTSISGVTKAAFTTQASAASAGGIPITNPPIGTSNAGVEAGSSSVTRDTYVQFRNADGTLFSELGGKWIAVASADLSFEQTLSISSQSSGAGAGKVAFNPLTLSFEAGALGPSFDQALAQGKIFQIEIATYRSAANGQQVRLDDYQFGTAALAKSHTSVDADGTHQTYSFEYNTQRTTHNLFGSNGQVNGTIVEGWDRTTNTQQLGDTTVSGSGVGQIHAPADAKSLTFYAGTVDTMPAPQPVPVVTVTLAHDTAPDLDASDAVTRTDYITSDATLGGTSTLSGTVTISEGKTVLSTTVIGTDGKWSFSPTLKDGPHELTVSQTNADGRIGVSVVQLTLDTKAPVVTVSLKTEADGSGADITTEARVTGTGEADGFVTVKEGTTTLGTALVDTDGTWNFMPTGLPAGTHTLTASQTDAAGNTGTSSLNFVLAGEMPPGTGSDTLVVRVSEDAYAGHAQYRVLVDGQQVGDTQMAGADHASGISQDVTFHGAFASAHTVSVEFLNDAYGGPGQDRNLYVEQVSLNGDVHLGSQASAIIGGAINGQTAGLYNNGAASFDLAKIDPPATGTGPDTLVFRISEDAYAGHAQYRVLVDGRQVGDIQFAGSDHASGTSQDVSFHGAFASTHNVSVEFLNDAYGGPGQDRNLYVEQVSLNGDVHLGSQVSAISGGAVNGTAAGLYNNGVVIFDLAKVAPPETGTGPDTLVFRISEDAYAGHAQYRVLVDGQQVGDTQMAGADHASGTSQDVTFHGTFVSAHTVSVEFLNDAYGGPSQDRNLYVEQVSLNGEVHLGSQASAISGGAVNGQAAGLYNNGSAEFNVSGLHHADLMA
jgi:type VI protein secretion system component Hcp